MLFRSSGVVLGVTLTILSGTLQLAFTIQCYHHICEQKAFITTLRLVITSHTKLYLKQHECEQPRDAYTSPLHLSSTHPSTHYPRNHSYIPRHHLFRAISHPSIPPQITLSKMMLLSRHICNSHVQFTATNSTFTENTTTRLRNCTGYHFGMFVVQGLESYRNE